jgi:hypothetical protein
MQYRVLWAPYAEDKLQLLLESSTDAGIVANAAREIDRYLFGNAGKFGESRYGNMRIGFVTPLGIQFEVMEDVHTAIVHDVWRIDRS